MKAAISLIAVTCLFSAVAQSATVYLDCDNCTEAQYKSLASDQLIGNSYSSPQEVYVADVTRESLRRFRVFDELEPGAHFHYVAKLTPSATEAERFQNYLDSRSQIIAALDALDFTIEVPPGHAVGSAYDLWGSNQKRLLIQELINAQLSFLEWAFSDFFATGSFLLDRKSSHLLVQVDFPDGSSAYFELGGKMQDLIWNYKEGQSIDADGNLIPDELTGFAGYAGQFNAVSVQDFLLRAALYNIPIVDQSSGSSRVAVVCVQDANGDHTCFVSTVR